MIRSIAALLVLCAAAPALAAEDAQVWFNGTVMGSVKGRLIYFAEVQPRFSGDAGGLDQLLLRPAIGWKLSDAVSAYAGYARVVTTVDGGRDRREDRAFQQLSWTVGPLAGGTLSSRTRLEQRRLRGFDDTGWRLRQMIRYVRPVGDRAGPRALVWAEPFVAFDDTDWGARAGFDQLRSFAGVELPVGGRSTVELGYLNQAVNRTAGRWRIGHTASVTLFLRH